MRRPRGFSLLEALVAVGLLAMMGTVTFGAFGRALDARERTTAMTDRYHELRAALSRMTLEMSQAFLSKHRDYSEPRSLTMFATKHGRHGSRLDFTSFSHYKFLKDANECDENELSYFVETSSKDPKRSHLMRREQKRIDERPDEGGDVRVLAHDVTNLSFQFYNVRTDRWDDAWDNKSIDTKDRLPKYVHIKLDAIDQNGRPMKLSTKVQILLQNAILITGSGFTPGID